MTHHRRGLRRLLRNDHLAQDFESNLEHAAWLSDRQSAMLRFVLKLTRTPSDMQKSDVDDLRRHGFQDLDVLHITEVAAYFAYVNRIADGLGVALER